MKGGDYKSNSVEASTLTKLFSYVAPPNRPRKTLFLETKLMPKDRSFYWLFHDLNFVNLDFISVSESVCMSNFCVYIACVDLTNRKNIG